MACKTISNLVNRAGLVYGIERNDGMDGRYYSMKRLDQLSTEVLKNALKFTGKCQMVAPAVAELKEETPAEHQPGVLIATALDSNYVACLDPLDGRYVNHDVFLHAYYYYSHSLITTKVAMLMPPFVQEQSLEYLKMPTRSLILVLYCNPHPICEQQDIVCIRLPQY